LNNTFFFFCQPKLFGESHSLLTFFPLFCFYVLIFKRIALGLNLPRIMGYFLSLLSTHKRQPRITETLAPFLFNRDPRFRSSHDF
jgi:hypothetical protein